MARIAGVDIPKIREVLSISSIRKSRAVEILEKAQVSQDKSSRLE
jgi:ribosomal protein S13